MQNLPIAFITGKTYITSLAIDLRAGILFRVTAVRDVTRE